MPAGGISFTTYHKMEYTMSDVNVIRLSSGEELICTVDNAETTSTRGTVYQISDVAVLIPTESNSLGLAPFMAYTEVATEGVTLCEKDIMFVTKPVEQLLQQYQNMFGKIMTQSQGIQV